MITNFSKVALLNNLPIVVRDEQTMNTYVFIMPTLRDENSGILNYNFFYGFCAATLKDLQERTKAEFSSKKEFLIKAINSGDTATVSLLGCLSKHIQDFKYVDDSLYCGEFELTDEIFETFCLYVAIASGCSKWEALEIAEKESTMTPEEREWERRKRENQARINAAKEKAGKGTDLEDIIIALTYEFNLSLEDVYSMNKFGIMELYSCIMRIFSCEYKKIAAGTGNLDKNSKFSYWTINK